MGSISPVNAARITANPGATKVEDERLDTRARQAEWAQKDEAHRLDGVADDAGGVAKDADKAVDKAEDVLTDASRDLQNAERVLSQEQERLAQEQGKVTEAQGALPRVDSELAGADRASSDAQRLLDAAQREQQAAQTRLDDALAEVKRAEQAVDRAEDVVNKAKNDLKNAGKAVDKARDAVNDARDDVQRASATVNDRQQDVTKAQGKVDAEERDVADARSKVSVAESDVGSAESAVGRARSSVARAQDEVNAARLSVASLERQLQADPNNASLKSQMSAAKQRLKLAESRLSSDKNSLKDAERALDSARKALEQARRALEQQQRELDEARRKLAEAKKQLQEAERKLKDAQAELAKAEQAFEAAESEQREATKRLQSAEQALDQAKSTLESERSGAKRAESALDDAKKQVDNAEATLDSARERVGDARKNLDKARERLDDAAKKVEERGAKVADATTKVDVARTAVSKARSTLDPAKATARTARSNADGTRARADAAEAERVRLDRIADEREKTGPHTKGGGGLLGGAIDVVSSVAKTTASFVADHPAVLIPGGAALVATGLDTKILDGALKVVKPVAQFTIDHSGEIAAGLAITGTVAMFVPGGQPLGAVLLGASLGFAAIDTGHVAYEISQARASWLDLGMAAVGLVPGAGVGGVMRAATIGARTLAVTRVGATGANIAAGAYGGAVTIDRMRKGEATWNDFLTLGALASGAIGSARAPGPHRFSGLDDAATTHSSGGSAPKPSPIGVRHAPDAVVSARPSFGDVVANDAAFGGPGRFDGQFVNARGELVNGHTKHVSDYERARRNGNTNVPDITTPQQYFDRAMDYRSMARGGPAVENTFMFRRDGSTVLVNRRTHEVAIINPDGTIGSLMVKDRKSSLYNFARSQIERAKTAHATAAGAVDAYVGSRALGAVDTFAGIEQARRFARFNRIEAAEPIVDGYRDAGSSVKFDDSGAPINPNREVIVIDRTRDVRLRAELDYAHSLRNLPEQQRAARIAEYVDSVNGGQGRGKLAALDGSSSPHLRGAEMLLGDIPRAMDGGVCRHRALLFKVLADEAGLDTTLVRGGAIYPGAQGKHAWNEITFSDGSTAVFDTMNPFDGNHEYSLPVGDRRVHEIYRDGAGVPVY